jgi:hypothetical protein
MNAWTDRPQVAAALLNPALIATLESVAAHEYDRAGTQAMSWPLAFLVAPLVLHRPTRQALPRDTRTHLATWVSRNSLLRAGFPARARSLTPVVREGLRFGLRHGVLSAESGFIRGSLRPDTAEGQLGELLRAAGLVGRWLAKTNQPSTAFALLGIAP